MRATTSASWGRRQARSQPRAWTARRLDTVQPRNSGNVKLRPGRSLTRRHPIGFTGPRQAPAGSLPACCKRELLRLVDEHSDDVEAVGYGFDDWCATAVRLRVEEPRRDG
jgi:hypothetical protein